MTTFERFEREIPRLMDELSPPQLPDYLDDMLRQTARTSQRPAWSALERWLPMGVIAQTRTIPRIPWRPILVVGLLVLLAAAALAVVGSQQQRLPVPFGPAANGMIVFSTVEGDIVSADPATGEVATLIAGEDSGFGSDPWFANDGTKFAFDRQTIPGASQRSLAIANADGSDVREISDPKIADPLVRLVTRGRPDDRPARRRPDRPGDARGRRNRDAGDVHRRHRPSGGLVPTGVGRAHPLRSGRSLRVRHRWNRPAQDRRRPAWLDQFSISPDGSLLAYATWVENVAEGRIHVVDIDSGIERPIDFDPGFDWTDLTPSFTPNGEAVLVERYDAIGYKPTILPLDGGPTVAFGEPHPAMTNGSVRSMSPDGEQLLVTYQDDGTTWLFDVATTEGTRLDWSPAEGTATTWQRLAP